MSDEIVHFKHSQLQHGKSNDRVYLMKVDERDLPEVIELAETLAEEHGYSKLFTKVPATLERAFFAHGFIEEARVPGLFDGEQEGVFLSRFVDAQRGEEQYVDTVQDVLAAARAKPTVSFADAALPAGYSCQLLGPQDAEDMAALYKVVFESYPFPIHDPDYLRQTMDEDVIYHGIRHHGVLVAVSSSEMNVAQKHVEMTDFATHPDQRGAGLASFLLEEMEQDMRRRGIRTAFTIARAYSFGMNITFSKHGYRFTGTLVNNTQIFGQLESMNIWFKAL